MKTINDKQYKECDVVMLTTDKAELGSIMRYVRLSPLHDDSIDKPLGSLVLNKNFAVTTSNIYWQSQHLYILSDDEINEGDWYIWLNNKQICQAEGMIMVINNHVNNGDIKKIIATTDMSLFINNGTFDDGTGTQLPLLNTFVPQIPQSFIEHYIEQHNQGNIIDKVLVEYEGSFGYSDSDSWESPVINIYNSINTLNGKTSWNRRELEKALFKFKDIMCYHYQIPNDEGFTSYKEMVNLISKNF